MVPRLGQLIEQQGERKRNRENAMVDFIMRHRTMVTITIINIATCLIIAMMGTDGNVEPASLQYHVINIIFFVMTMVVTWTARSWR